MASDHAGVMLRQAVAVFLQEQGHIIHDLGPVAGERVDYPDYAGKLADAMRAVPASKGVLVCGSGIGISIAANRYPWIRAALCCDATMARLSRQHNDANVLALGERLCGMETAMDIAASFFSTGFEGGRHAARVEKLSILSK